DEESRRLPPMSAGEALAKRAIAATQHFTEPPPRYSEASLVKRMEELGIGRPSTYAAILQVLKDRGYVRIDKKRLVAEDKGRFGAFLGCSNYPEWRFTRTLAVPAEGAPENGHKKLGEDPTTGLDVTLRSGRFGPYVQLGEAVEGEKPKRAGLPRGLAIEDLDLDRALGLLALPREVGQHPESGEPILAGVGRF